VRELRRHGGSAFAAAAGKYDELQKGQVSFIAKSQLSPWNRSLDVRGITERAAPDQNVWLVGESSRSDFLVTAVHESLHLSGIAESDPELVKGVRAAYMQLSVEERKTATWTKKWLDERTNPVDKKHKEDE
jgi:hypothetical protein